MGKIFLGNLSMRKILVMTSSTSVRTLSGWRWGGREAGGPLGTGVFEQFSLVGNSPGSVAFGNPRFSGGKSSIIDEQDEQRDKEQERAREKRPRKPREKPTREEMRKFK